MNGEQHDQLGKGATHTALARGLASPLRSFLATETASGLALLGAAVAALIWANASPGTYESLWSTNFSISVGGEGLSLDLRHWVNDGLMTVFFFLVGLEARREFDMGELRERRRGAIAVVASLGGMTLAALIFLAINAGKDSADGWAAVIACDTAFALGALTLIGPNRADRLRVFLLTVVIVEDFVALTIIATFYSSHIDLGVLAITAALVVVFFLLPRLGVRRDWQFAVVGVSLWFAALHSGVHPTTVGLLMGLSVTAHPASRFALERVTKQVRSFREQPSAELAHAARKMVALGVSPNERIQHHFHPWTSFLIVPVFALANIGIALDGETIERAARSPITLGIVAGFAIGKPIGIIGAAWTATRLRPGRLPRPGGWGALAGTGTMAGIGFTVAMLVSTLAFEGEELAEAKIGILAAGVISALLGAVVFAVIRRLPAERRAQQLAAGTKPLIDLEDAVDPEIDHIRGPLAAAITLVEYGDFECPHCGRAEAVTKEMLSASEHDVRYVFRHLPLNDVHPHAQLAAEAAEAAAAQGRFWEMYDRLFDHQKALEPHELVEHADAIGLNRERFVEDLRSSAHAARVARDVDSAEASDVTGTPTLFVNGHRHRSSFSQQSVRAAIGALRSTLTVAGR